MATGVDIPKEMWALLENQPLVAPPDGVIPNFAGREHYGYPIVIASAICIPLVIILAAIRLYVRLYVVRKWALDDYTFVLSVPAGLALIGLNIAVIYGGAFGYHAWDVTIGDLTKPILERSVAIGVIQGPITWLIKLTLFCLILTVFRPVTWLRMLAIVGIAVTGAFYLFTSIYYGVTCGPKGGLDRPSYLAGMAGSKCHDPNGFIQIYNILHGAFNVFSDLYILIIPIPAILQLHLPLKRKLGVLAIFLAGLGACAMSGLALYFRTKIYRTQDNNHDMTDLLTVITIEISVGMIIPTFPALATVTRRASDRTRLYLHTRYGWSLGGDSSSETYEGQAAADSELEKYRKRRLPNGKTYSQSDTIDRMVFGVNGSDFLSSAEKNQLSSDIESMQTSRSKESSSTTR